MTLVGSIERATMWKNPSVACGDVCMTVVPVRQLSMCVCVCALPFAYEEK